MSHPVYGLNELREMFLRFFESKGHLRLPSFSLIPQNDKSILLINAGMTPMKPWLKGEEEPPRRRVCTCASIPRCSPAAIPRPRTTRPLPSGATRSVFLRSASSASARRITSGSMDPVRAVPAPKFTTTAARSTAAVSPAARSAATATAMLRCGTTSFPSSTTTVITTTPS